MNEFNAMANFNMFTFVFRTPFPNHVILESPFACYQVSVAHPSSWYSCTSFCNTERHNTTSAVQRFMTYSSDMVTDTAETWSFL